MTQFTEKSPKVTQSFLCLSEAGFPFAQVGLVFCPSLPIPGLRALATIPLGLRFLFHLFISGFHSDPSWCGVFYFIAQALLQLPAVLLPQGQDCRCEPHTWLTSRL